MCVCVYSSSITTIRSNYIGLMATQRALELRITSLHPLLFLHFLFFLYLLFLLHHLPLFSFLLFIFFVLVFLLLYTILTSQQALSQTHYLCGTTNVPHSHKCVLQINLRTLVVRRLKEAAVNVFTPDGPEFAITRMLRHAGMSSRAVLSLGPWSRGVHHTRSLNTGPQGQRRMPWATLVLSRWPATHATPLVGTTLITEVRYNF